MSEFPIVVEGAGAVEAGRAMLPVRVPKAPAGLVESPDFEKNLSDVARKLGAIVDALPEVSEKFALDSVDVSLAVTQEGKIGILSVLDLSAGARASITLRLKRR